MFMSGTVSQSTYLSTALDNDGFMFSMERLMLISNLNVGFSDSV